MTVSRKLKWTTVAADTFVPTDKRETATV
jgi:hypothetical protein